MHLSFAMSSYWFFVCLPDDSSAGQAGESFPLPTGFKKGFNPAFPIFVRLEDYAPTIDLAVRQIQWRGQVIGVGGVATGVGELADRGAQSAAPIKEVERRRTRLAWRGLERHRR